MYRSIILITFVATLATGCATKSRSIEMKGMYASEAGTVAIGSVDISAAPEGTESAYIKYAEDTAWLSPTTKTHKINIMLTGTNSVEKVDDVVKHICEAFVETGKESSKPQTSDQQSESQS